MRHGYLRVVSSALLLLSWMFAPHPSCNGSDTGGTSCQSLAPVVVISEFYPCALSGDEYFSISCMGTSCVCLNGWVVSDGEGEIGFVSDLLVLPGIPFTVSFNSSSYWAAYDSLPDVTIDLLGSSSLVAVNGSFRLADSGDSISLVSPYGSVVDVVIYGSANCSLEGWHGSAIPALRKGEVAKRLERSGILEDTDTSSDWEPFREYKYGYTQLSPRSFDISAGGITAFTSPDCALDVVTQSIDQARTDIMVCSYEFSSAPVAERLMAAITKGVRIVVLVDGAPAGDISESEVACLSVLRTAGADVRVVNGNISAGIAQHVGALHAKYMVVDSTRCIVLSENFAEDGIPSDTVFGNRGWGVAVTSAGLSEYLRGMFESDARPNRPDVGDWIWDRRCNSSAVLPEWDQDGLNAPLIDPLETTAGAVVTVCPSPDSSVAAPFLSSYMHAQNRILIEQFQADLYWTSRWTGERYLSPLLEAVIGSADKGVSVKALLDSAWFNVDRNTAVVECLNNASCQDGEVHAKLMDQRSPMSLLHNKGVAIDGITTAITSNNWVSASFARNRELALMLESSEIAQYFEKAFEYDWSPDECAPTCDAGPDIELLLGCNATLDARSCSDDRQLVNFTWDFDADGIADGYGRTVMFEAEVPGDHLVVLKVRDSWGNTAFDELRVHVVDPADNKPDEANGGSLNYYWAAPAALALGVVTAGVLRKRRSARNLNHRPRS